MKKQPSNQLVCHISHTFWNIEQSAVRTCLEQYDGEWFKEEEQPKKHPIELVNEKYPNGWYCEAFEELKNDLVDITNDEQFAEKVWLYLGFKGIHKQLGKKGYFASKHIQSFTLITRTEYLSITRPQEVEPTKKNLDIEEPKQRDWTGVRFKHKNKIFTNGGVVISKYDLYYRVKHPDKERTWLIEDVDRYFETGYWIELPAEAEQPTIHSEKPNDLEARIEALNNRIINLEKRLNII